MKLNVFRGGLHLNKTSLLYITGGLTALYGSYYVFSKPDVLSFVTGTIDNIVVNPFKDFVIDPIEKSVSVFRYGFTNIGVTLKDWVYVSFEGINNRVEEVNNKGLITVGVEGGKQVLGTIRGWIHSFAEFLFGYLIPFANEHTVSDIVEYIKDYSQPMKQLLSRPDNNRLKSDRNRLQQLFDAFKTPGFFSSLIEMNRFFFEFKEQLKELNDDQMGELVDTYLEDPLEMQKKVSVVMEYMEKDANIKSKFDVNLMMDFVRGENVDAIKARFAANKVAEKLSEAVGKITSIFGVDSSGVKDEANRYLENKLTEAFTNIVSWWHSS